MIPKMIFSITFINIAMVIMSTNLPTFTLAKGNGIEATYGFYLAAMSIGIMIGTILAPKLKHHDFGKLIIVDYPMIYVKPNSKTIEILIQMAFPNI